MYSLTLITISLAYDDLTLNLVLMLNKGLCVYILMGIMNGGL